MKKVLLILLILIFGFNSAIKASDNLNEEIKIEKTTRNWTQEAKHFGYGLLAVGASYVVSSMDISETIPDIINLVSTYYITSSLMNLGRYCLESYGESLAKKTSLLKKKQPTRKQSKKIKLRPSDIKNIEHATQENIRLTRAFLRQTQSLINAALKISTFYMFSQDYLSEAPKSALFLASILTSGLAYNINEVRHTYTTGQARNDIPLLGIIDGITEGTLANNLFYNWQNRGFEIAPGIFLPILMRLTSSQWAIYRFLQMHGDVQAINGALQIIRNTTSGLYTYLTRQPQIIEEIFQSPTAAQPPQAAVLPSQPAALQQPLAPLPAAIQIAQPPQPLAAAQPAVGAQPHLRAVLAPVPQQLPAPLPAAQPPQPTAAHQAAIPLNLQPAGRQAHHAAVPLQQQAATAPSSRDLERQKNLGRIQELRRAVTIKKSVIDSEIRQLLAFLTNAHLENIGHGKRAIIINFKDDKSFRIPFEAPHEQSNAASDEYKGYRKTRVLDALQVGYLQGWNQASIIQFMNANNINRFYNIPLFLIHILWERGQYQ